MRALAWQAFHYWIIPLACLTWRPCHRQNASMKDVNSLAMTGSRQKLQAAMHEPGRETGSQHIQPHALPSSPLSMKETGCLCR